MEYAVSVDGTTLVTLHEGTDTTAESEAIDQLTATLESLVADGTISEWSVDEATVYEHPTAPFDPYTIKVAFVVTVVVDAESADDATTSGGEQIDDALESAGVDSVTYQSGPVASQP